MGLDSYLDKVHYIGGNYEHRKISGTVTFHSEKQSLVIDPKTVTKISCKLIEWRKMHGIHGWFVENVQDGNDDSGVYEFNKDKLKLFFDDLKYQIENPDEHILIEDDCVVYNDVELFNILKETYEILKKEFEYDEPFFTEYYQYCSSW
jgi:hypothetical protein